ncbi:MAG: hypothetical protein DWQ40_03560 [Actinobacteria bacterium]|nr:MAG: hypothetical protein DWQ40_03560 [Actinomycetota bacterium]REK38785.1 MAG: hypothetical protein DWQ20_03380 [Actinomycetota bacterium]
MSETVTNRESPVELLKRYGILAYGALGNMLDTGLVVLGTLLVGLGLTVLLSGFGVLGPIEDMSTVAMLASSLILIVVGLFALGVASEGPLGRGRRLVGFNIWEVGIGRALAAFLVGLGLLLAYRVLVEFVSDLPVVFMRGVDGLHAVSVSGMVAVPLVGVPLSLLLRSLPETYGWAKRYEIQAIFLVWLLSTLILL